MRPEREAVELGKTGSIWTVITLAAAAALAGCLVAGFCGCGSSESDTSASVPPGEAGPPHLAATGPAVEVKLKFDELALESTPKKVTDSKGLQFLYFKYADTDGKVYKCVLPAAMAQEARTPSEWLALFEMYREPEVVAKKAPRPTAPHAIGDFPFISPRPAASTPSKQEQPEATTPTLPGPMPSLPPMPTGPGVPTPPGAGPTRDGVMPSPQPTPTGPAMPPTPPG